MNKCSKCNQSIPLDANFCSNCGAGYQGNHDSGIGYVPSSVKVLCILTIIGSVFAIFRGLIYFQGSSDMAFRALFYILTSIGTATGAVMMLSKKLTGLYIYTASQIIYIATALFASSTYDEYWGFTGFVTMIFVAPAIIFIILYWAIAREYLE